MQIIRMITVLGLLFLSTHSQANGLRCGVKLVMEGDTTYEVTKKCGKPDSEEDLGYIKDHGDYIKVTRYVYDMGSSKFLQLLDFHNGKLAKITDGPRQ